MRLHQALNVEWGPNSDGRRRTASACAKNRWYSSGANVVNNGKDPQTWELTGSPLLH
ncbi:hypothetical protein [Streptomyces violascens]|uniref:hypothetical protein n=1 Tax=Streptomyces violascens TaxID=67381 RepID=UPI0036A8D5C2